MAIFLAGVLVVFSLAQLFTFDEFVELIPAFELPFNGAVEYLLAPLIIAAEVFAIPFLLGMTLSVAFRWLSMMLGWFEFAFWTFVSLWVVLTKPAVETMGFLGTAVPLIPGWWAVFVLLALCIAVAWTSWGLWPGRRSK